MNKARGQGQRGAQKKRDCRPSKIMEVMAVWQCTVCHIPCEDEGHTERSIECFVCKQWAHQTCTGIKDGMFDNLTKAPNTQWVCTPCLESMGEPRDERKLDMLLSMIPLMGACMHHKVVGNFESEADVRCLYYRHFRFNDTSHVGACTHGRPAK